MSSPLNATIEVFIYFVVLSLTVFPRWGFSLHLPHGSTLIRTLKTNNSNIKYVKVEIRMELKDMIRRKKLCTLIEHVT